MFIIHISVISLFMNILGCIITTTQLFVISKNKIMRYYGFSFLRLWFDIWFLSNFLQYENSMEKFTYDEKLSEQQNIELNLNCTIYDEYIQYRNYCTTTCSRNEFVEYKFINSFTYTYDIMLMIGLSSMFGFGYIGYIMIRYML